MKHTYLSLLCLISFGLTAQITVTNATFPAVGDTLMTATDNMPVNIQVGAPGPDQVWNFKSLQSPVVLRTVIRAAAEGEAAAAFPEADLVYKANENAEGYYKVTANELTLLGLSGTDPLNLGIDIRPRLSPPQIERRAPLQYNDDFESSTSLSYAVSADQIPAELLADLPITPDSLRVRLRLDRQDEIDAWGTVQIPGGNYEVLREKRTIDQDVRIDAKVGFLGWQDITDIVVALTGIGADILGNNQIVRYYYWSETAKEPIAVVTTGPGGTEPLTVTFKAEDVLSNIVQQVDVMQPGVIAYPNPAMVYTNFQFVRLKPGTYRLILYNMLGAEVWRGEYYVNGTHTQRVGVAHLKKGTYLYALQDQRGRTLITRRLLIVKP